MDKERVKKLKEELNDSFSDDYIRNTGLLIYKLAKEFYEVNKLEGKVYFNVAVFEYCLIDILVDIARLKHFHDIKHVNYIKFIAYTASWFLKRKPFQLIKDSGEKYIYVNERFALTILMQSSGCCDDKVFYNLEERQNIENDIRKIFYHLKYRNTNPQTLELFLLGFEIGKKVRIID